MEEPLACECRNPAPKKGRVSDSTAPVRLSLKPNSHPKHPPNAYYPFRVRTFKPFRAHTGCVSRVNSNGFIDCLPATGSNSYVDLLLPVTCRLAARPADGDQELQSRTRSTAIPTRRTV